LRPLEGECELNRAISTPDSRCANGLPLDVAVAAGGFSDVQQAPSSRSSGLSLIPCSFDYALTF